MNKNSIIAVAATLIVAGGVGFFAGMKYQEGKIPQFAKNNRFTQGQRPNGSANGFTPISGKIIGKDDGSITVELPDGGSKIILLTENSKIAKTEDGSADDLTQDTEVVVFGTENSDGSITAQNVQIGGSFLRRPEANTN